MNDSANNSSNNIRDPSHHGNTNNVEKLKQDAASVVKETKEKYTERENAIHRLLTNQNKRQNKKFGEAYENLLRENAGKIQEIAKKDFEKSAEESQKLINDAKSNVKDLFSNIFKDSNEKKAFAKVAEDMIDNIHGMVRRDIVKQNNLARKSASRLSQTLDVFPPLGKVPEEIEAEKLLQQGLEEQLLEYSNTFHEHFKEANDLFNKQVDKTKAKMADIVDKAATNASKNIPAKDSKFSIPKQDETVLKSLPNSSTVEHNVNSILQMTSKDFHRMNAQMKSEIDQQKSKVSENVGKVVEKLLGCVNDEEEDQGEGS